MTGEPRKVNRKERVGTVVSDKGEQTIVVAIERAARHRLYRKVIRQTKKYHVHDPENAATAGDIVRIEECRPISKTKHWRLVAVLSEHAVAEVAPEELDVALVDEVQRSAARAADAAAVASGEAAVAAARPAE
ncbi:MAG: 30S ribosomal protein S17 [Dehalococcoidia bacterium]|nr:30S ribosomal protein S17 [Dehalococcoidia bacterium]